MHNKSTIVNWPFQIRDSRLTATASVTTGTVAALATGDTTTFLDLVHVTMANNSTVAATVALKDDGTTVKTFRVPADNTLVFDASNLPLHQGKKGGNWQVDMEDITGTTISVDALFVKNDK